MSGYNAGLTKSPPARKLSPKEANEMLTKWHYLGAVSGIIAAFGHDEGCLVFTNCRSRFYEAKHPGVIELTRMVGMPNHKWAMSSLMTKCEKEIWNLGYKRIVTYADPFAGHDGKVYLAANYKFDGVIERDGHPLIFIDGKMKSPKGLYNIHGTQSVPALKQIYGHRVSFAPKPLKKRFIKDYPT